MKTTGDKGVKYHMDDRACESSLKVIVDAIQRRVICLIRSTLTL